MAGSPGKAGARGRRLRKIQVKVICCGNAVRPLYSCPTCKQPAGENRKYADSLRGMPR